MQVCEFPECLDIILDGICPAVVGLCYDVNGNHVIKLCMAKIPPGIRERLFSIVINNCIEVSDCVFYD